VPITRRNFLIGGISLPLAACAGDDQPDFMSVASPVEMQIYGALEGEPYPIPAVDLRKLKSKYRRQIVDYPIGELPGAIVVDTPRRFLYLVIEDGKAMRYGVGIGRDGFAWGGRAHIRYKRAWPRWTPPDEMIARQPELEEYRYGMEAGLDNPLGARALYIFDGDQDTLYRIHGTQDAASIGRAVSSGCVRLINQDVIDLFNRVRPGAEVIVKQEEGQT
jgi:lipoprotein-anchoring transpeptidase ErfK/SrfK